jgi:uncharacterized protein (TIGR03118 family)
MTPWWVADNGMNVATLYTGAGAVIPRVFQVGDAPTGLVFNRTTGSTDFDIKGGDAGRALFLFDSEAGVISAWNPSLGTTAEPEVTVPGAVFKGLAIAQTAAGARLYATDFHNGQVDVFDGSWQPVNMPFQFVDPAIPSDYAPFGIQAIGSQIFVTYAKTQAGSDDEAHGQGLGFVDAFDAATGLLDARVAMHGQLNAPWGLAMAPESFGGFGGDLLVGNFGDGQITTFEPIMGGSLYVPRGQLRTPDDGRVMIDGLWSLQFGRGGPSGSTDTLFFTAGPNDEHDGLFGSITPSG